MVKSRETKKDSRLSSLDLNLSLNLCCPSPVSCLLSPIDDYRLRDKATAEELLGEKRYQSHE